MKMVAIAQRLHREGGAASAPLSVAERLAALVANEPSQGQQGGRQQDGGRSRSRSRSKKKKKARQQGDEAPPGAPVVEMRALQISGAPAATAASAASAAPAPQARPPAAAPASAPASVSTPPRSGELSSGGFQPAAVFNGRNGRSGQDRPPASSRVGAEAAEAKAPEWQQRQQQRAAASAQSSQWRLHTSDKHERIHELRLGPTFELRIARAASGAEAPSVRAPQRPGAPGVRDDDDMLTRLARLFTQLQRSTEARYERMLNILGLADTPDNRRHVRVALTQMGHLRAVHARYFAQGGRTQTASPSLGRRFTGEIRVSIAFDTQDSMVEARAAFDCLQVPGLALSTLDCGVVPYAEVAFEYPELADRVRAAVERDRVSRARARVGDDHMAVDGEEELDAEYLAVITRHEVARFVSNAVGIAFTAVVMLNSADEGRAPHWAKLPGTGRSFRPVILVPHFAVKAFACEAFRDRAVSVRAEPEHWCGGCGENRTMKARCGTCTNLEKWGVGGASGERAYRCAICRWTGPRSSPEYHIAARCESRGFTPRCKCGGLHLFTRCPLTAPKHVPLALAVKAQQQQQPQRPTTPPGQQQHRVLQRGAPSASLPNRSASSASAGRSSPPQRSPPRQQCRARRSVDWQPSSRLLCRSGWCGSTATASVSITDARVGNTTGATHRWSGAS